MIGFVGHQRLVTFFRQEQAQETLIFQKRNELGQAREHRACFSRPAALERHRYNDFLHILAAPAQGRSQGHGRALGLAQMARLSIVEDDDLALGGVFVHLIKP